MNKHMRVIALEEAFLHPKLRALYPADYVKQLDLISSRLTDVGVDRIKRMDAAGIDLQVLSHVSPGVQTLDTETAIRLSVEINNWLGDMVKIYPDRFAGFAMLPMQAPEEAAAELERTITNLGFKGALINGHTNGRYLDEDFFSPVLAMAEKLNVPIYIHPTDPPAGITAIYYKDYPAMVTGGWGWQVETGTHVLRMISGGVFDRYPRLKIIIGHMGELIPYNLQRINKSLTLGNWLIGGQRVMQRSVYYYLRQNVFITTSGVFDQAAFACALKEIGLDNLLFSVDDPFGDNFEAMEFLKAIPLSAADKAQLASGNAERVLGLLPTVPAERMSSSLGSEISNKLNSVKASLKSKLGRMVLTFLTN